MPQLTINLKKELENNKINLLFETYHQIRAMLQEAKSTILDSIYLLNSIKNDRYQTRNLELYEEGNLNYVYQKVCRIIEIWFHEVWFPKIKDNNQKIFQISENFKLFNVTEQSYHLLEIENLNSFLNNIALSINHEITKFSQFLQKEIVVDYSTTDHIINFPFFGDILQFLKSLVIFPYKVSYGNSYNLLNKIDSTLNKVVKKFTKFSNKISEKNLDTFQMLCNHIIEINKFDFNNWRKNDFSKVAMIVHDNFIQSLQSLELAAVYFANSIDNLDNTYLDNDNIMLYQENLLVNIEKLKNYNLAIINFLNEILPNWQQNISEKFCSEQKKQLIQTFETKLNDTLNLALVNLEIINKQFKLKSKVNNFNIRLTNLENSHNHITTIIANLKLAKKHVNQLKHNFPQNSLFFYDNYLLNSTYIKQFFDYKQLNSWKNSEVALEICRLSTNLYVSQKDWENHYFPELLYLINEYFVEIFEFAFIDINEFFIKNEKFFIDNNLQVRLRTEDKNYLVKEVEKIKCRLTEHQGAIDKIWDKWNTKKSFIGCTDEQWLVIDNVNQKIYEKYLYSINNFKTIDFILSKFEKSLIVQTDNKTIITYEINPHFQFILLFFRELKARFNKYETISSFIDSEKTYNEVFDFENLEQWNNNNQILEICSLDIVGLDKLHLGKNSINFVNRKHAKEIMVWQYKYFPKLLEVISDNFVQVFQKLYIELDKCKIKFYSSISALNSSQVIDDELNHNFENFITVFNKNINYLFQTWENWKENVNLQDCYKQQLEEIISENDRIFSHFTYGYEKLKNANQKFIELKHNIELALATRNHTEMIFVFQEAVDYLEIASDEIIHLKNSIKTIDFTTTSANVDIMISENDAFDFENIEQWNANHQLLEICNFRKQNQDRDNNFKDLKKVFEINFFNNSNVNQSMTEFSPDNVHFKKVPQVMGAIDHKTQTNFHFNNFTSNNKLSFSKNISITLLVIPFLVVAIGTIIFLLITKLQNLKKSDRQKNSESLLKKDAQASVIKPLEKELKNPDYFTEDNETEISLLKEECQSKNFIFTVATANEEESFFI